MELRLMFKQAHYSYNDRQTKNHLNIYRVDLSRDFDRLYTWMHQPHVAKFWQLNLPHDQLLAHFKAALAMPHQELFILQINGQITGYAETYYAPDDRLAQFCQLQAGDFGIHLLIGEQNAIGKGYSSLIVRGLSDYLFTQHMAERVLLEPNAEVSALSILERKLGFSNLGNLELPEKVATLYAITHHNFYKHNPSEIACDLSNWPIIKLHFPSFPSDEAVDCWIRQLDEILLRQESYVVISTFDREYQFSQQARKVEMAWFKRNKPLLAKYCCAMLRVTNDTEMIAKLSSPAMEKGMPFRCIPVQTLELAVQQAKLIFKSEIHSNA